MQLLECRHPLHTLNVILSWKMSEARLLARSVPCDHFDATFVAGRRDTGRGGLEGWVPRFNMFLSALVTSTAGKDKDGQSLCQISPFGMRLFVLVGSMLNLLILNTGGWGSDGFLESPSVVGCVVLRGRLVLFAARGGSRVFF